MCVFVLCTPARAQWTEPVRLTQGISLMDPHAVTVGDTIHVVAKGTIYAYYLRSNDNGLTWTEPVCLPSDFYRRYMPDIAYADGYLHIVFR